MMGATMARLHDYSRRRFLVMQAVLCTVLGASVAVAALVSQVKARSSRVELAQTVQLDNVAIQLPAGWEIDDDPDADGIGIVAGQAGNRRQRPVRVELSAPSLIDLFTGANRAGVRAEEINFGDAQRGTLARERYTSRFQRNAPEVVILQARGELPRSRRITISTELLDPSESTVRRSAALLKSIAASTRLIANDRPQLRSK
jgi:hypothetical protein